MTIHVVQRDDTINSIADRYGVSADRLIIDNGIKNPNLLVVGEAIVILKPEISYTIQEGDTLGSIADQYEVTIMQLLRNNPYLSDREYIYPGETIVISYENNIISTVAINAYAFPFIEMNVLRKTLPFLTYLTIYSYEVTDEGEINDIDDLEIIQTAKAYGVAPIMMLTASSGSMEDEINVIHSILSSNEIQERFITNILGILETKGYSGVSIVTPYILPTDRILYEEFIVILADRLSKAGYKAYITFNIRIFQLLNGTIFTGIDYSKLAQVVDGINLISYEFGYSEGIPAGTTSMDTLGRFIEFTTRLIPSELIYIGVPAIGYVWRLPYIPIKSRGMAISYDSVLDLAIENGTEIQYDEITNTAYFQYISDDEFVVRFWDARSADNFVKLVPEFEIKGINIWNIMNWFPQMWLVINSQYEIDKVMI
jgi:spore germination protein